MNMNRYSYRKPGGCDAHTRAAGAPQSASERPTRAAGAPKSAPCGLTAARGGLAATPSLFSSSERKPADETPLVLKSSIN